MHLALRAAMGAALHEALHGVSAVVLSGGAWSVGVDPDHGGACSHLTWQPSKGPRLDLLRPTPVGAHVFEASAFAMLPYANRLFGAVLRTPDRTLTLPANHAGLGLPVHGLGWGRRWDIADEGPQGIRLSYCAEAGADWPWAHSAQQRFRLGQQGLRVELALRNEDSRAMPAGMGYHPRFAVERTAQLRFSATHQWLQDASGAPERAQCLEGAGTTGRLDAPQPVEDVVLNHCFSGWGRCVSIERPDHGVRVYMQASRALGHLMVYRTPGQSWLCLEPMSHATGAFSLRLAETHAQMTQTTALGPHLLAPGQTLRACLHIGLISHHSP